MPITYSAFYRRLASHAIVVLCLLSNSANAAEAKLMELVVPPQPVPYAVWEDEMGNKLSPADYKGKKIIVHFWATWCPPCVDELPKMMKIQEAAKKKGITFVPISLDRQPIKAQLFYQEHDIKMPLYFDGKGKSLREFGFKGLPSSAMVDEKGNIIAARQGVVEWAKQSLDFH